MNLHEQINEYMATQPEPKRSDLQDLHRIILQLMPDCQLWFLDGKDEKGRTVSNPNMEINNDFGPMGQEFLRLAGSLGPCPASFRNVLSDFRDTPISTGCRKALRLDAHNLRVKILCDTLQVIAIDCGEKLFQYFYFVVHRSPSEAMQVARPNQSPPGGSI